MDLCGCQITQNFSPRPGTPEIPVLWTYIEHRWKPSPASSIVTNSLFCIYYTRDNPTKYCDSDRKVLSILFSGAGWSRDCLRLVRRSHYEKFESGFSVACSIRSDSARAVKNPSRTGTRDSTRLFSHWHNAKGSLLGDILSNSLFFTQWYYTECNTLRDTFSVINLV